MRLFALAALLTCAAVSAAADWPMGGRGGDRNPVCPEAGGPVDWHIPALDQTPPDTSRPRNLRWSAARSGGPLGAAEATIGSRAIGGPVVAGGLVWVGTNDAARIDADDGSKTTRCSPASASPTASRSTATSRRASPAGTRSTGRGRA